MKAQEFFKSKKGFLSREKIQKYISNSEKFDSSIEDSNSAETILLFSTSKQKTWLIVTNRRMYCILDDIRKNKPLIAWSKPKSALTKDNEVYLDITAQDKTDEVGIVNIGPKMKNWYYTKSLFDKTKLSASIKGTIRKKMLE
ncbi:MAG: hypothetical protein IH840_00420 [Candidatus Heimdallarchaeota archaeon]|nr:hypothetical protein [Candidatus Heimdallarchaeota archaeon]